MSSRKPITVKYQNTIRDYLRSDSAMHSRMPMKTNQMSAIMLLGFGAYTVYANDVGAITYVCFAMGIMQWFRLIQKGVVMIMTRTNARALQPSDAVFDDNGFHLTTPIQKIRAPWNVFEEIVETPDAFLFMLGRGRYTMVPKRAFSEKQLRAFRELLQKHELMKMQNG